MINVGLYIKKETVFDSGINTSSSNFKIIDLSKTWVSNQWQNYYIRIVRGTGKGYFFKCNINGVSVLEFDTLPFNLDSTSEYEIFISKTHRIELFKDEKISVTSSIQNANDLGKLFTDYSQSFTIPASTINNVSSVAIPPGGANPEIPSAIC